MSPLLSPGEAAPRDWAPTRNASPRDWEATRDALVCPRAADAYIELDAQIRGVQVLSHDVGSAPAKAYIERCVTHIDGVRDAIHDLHFGVFEAKIDPEENKASPLVQYLVATYLWCRDMLEDLRRHASPMHASTSRREGDLAEHSASYVRDHVEPFFMALCRLCEAATGVDHPLHRLLQRAKRVYSQIVCLDWTLEVPRAVGADSEPIPFARHA